MVDIISFVKDNNVDLEIRYSQQLGDYIIKMTRYPLKIERHICKAAIIQHQEEKILNLTLQDMLNQLDREEFIFKHGGRK